MLADIPTTYNIPRVPRDQPHYHVGAWGGECPVKEDFIEEIMCEWFSKNRRSPRGRWGFYQVKGEACPKTKKQIWESPGGF